VNDDLAKMIAKLELHKGGVCTLSRSELQAVTAWLRDYVSLMRKLEGVWGRVEDDDEKKGTY